MNSQCDSSSVYFAYGTLLDQTEMTRFCPSAKSLGIFRLPGYRLSFAYCKKNRPDGGCDLVSAPENLMFGVLYEMPPSELSNLSKLSGHGDGLWTDMQITLLDENDREVPAKTYIIPTPSGDFSPVADYVAPILKGLDQPGIPESYKNQVKEIIDSAMNRA